MADPNNVLMHRQRIAAMFICKAANTSVKQALADKLNLPDVDLEREELKPHRKLSNHLPTPVKTDVWKFRQEGYLTFAVIRHPLARLASCYADKVETRIHPPFLKKYRADVRQGMPFREWVEFVARTPDIAADQHFRSMAWDLVSTSDRIIPAHIFKVEDAGWWNRLRERIMAHCEMDIGPERIVNASRHRDWPEYYDDETREMAARRYADDLRHFGY